MNFADLIKTPQVLIKPAVKLLTKQGKQELATTLTNAQIIIEQTGCDNYNGGTDLYTVVASVPADLMPGNLEEVEGAERQIEEIVKICLRGYYGIALDRFILRPDPNGSVTATTTMQTEHSIASDNHWEAGCFRLFMSHSSADKEQLAALKTNLRKFGVDAFLAHQDIEPAAEWKQVILECLYSCDAVAAFVTEGFVKSRWTDQEVGIAIGRGKYVQPIHLGVPPYGFMSDIQAVIGNWSKLDDIASGIARALMKADSTREAFREPLVNSACCATCFDDAATACNIVMQYSDYPASLLSRLERAVLDNRQVRDAHHKKLGPAVLRWIRAETVKKAT